MIVTVDLKRTSTVHMKNVCESSHMNVEKIEGFEYVTDKFNLLATEAAFQYQIK
jgi:hypothetical protein